MKRSALILGLILSWNTANAQVDALLSRWNQLDSPGAAVAVIHNGKIVHKRGYGQASLEHRIPITPKTVFDVASVSKQFTAFAVAMLADENKLSLDDDIRQHLPEMPDLGHTITIRHLIHHTSGLRDWPGVLAMAGRSMEDRIAFEEILTMARHQTALNFVPGDRYSYSNTGYNLLALIVERVSGLSFRAFTQRHIFRPLGMIHSWFQDDHEEQVADRALGYRSVQSSHSRIGNNLMALGSSSLHTTIDDLILWINNFTSRQVGSDAVHALMQQQGTLNSGDAIPYAFGQVVSTYRGLQTISHSGSWAGFRSMLLRFPDHQLSIVIASNTADISAPSLAYDIAELYLSDHMTSAEPSPPLPEEFDINVSDYTGIYDVNAALVVELSQRDDKLLAHLPNAQPFVMQAVGPDSFFVSAWNDTVTFERGINGQVSHMVGLGQSTARQLRPQTINLRTYTGGYYSMELKVSYTLLMRDDALLAIGPRGDEIRLFPATEDVFVTDRWFMPVIRFSRDSNDRLTQFSASNARSLRVEFRR